jgi:tripartite-type tricarboxylate transporter receptor subunit TctC
MNWKSPVLAIGLVKLLVVCALSGANAQEWPSKVTRILVGTAAGGTADSLARLLADKFTDGFKQSFIVENHTGAGGLIAMEQVRKSEPDGYTLLVTGGSQHTIMPAMMKNFPYDPLHGVTYIAYLGGPPNVLIVNPNVPAHTLKEFIALAKKEPGKLSFGSPGNGTNGHLAAEYLDQLAGIEMVHVPYRGSNPALIDVVAGHLPSASMTLTSAAPQIRAGKVRALAVTSQERVPGFPDVPTFAEEGFPDIVSLSWFSLSGPPGMPAEIVRRLNAEANRILRLADVRKRLAPEGFLEPSNLDPKGVAALVAEESNRWSKVVRKSGITMGR